jgi:protein-L-isoaspartate(D-aspartate) O-methyltransferase
MAAALKNSTGIGMTSQRTRARMVERLREQGIRDERVLAAMGSVPRHLFVEEALASRAYEDTALPIGFGQTISQPYVVARMAETLLAGKAARKDPRGRYRLRLSGGGAGAAFPRGVLDRAHQGLHERARANLLGLRLKNLRLVHGDGYAGLEKAAPFQSIILAAAPREVPQALQQQLAPGGRMVLPLEQVGRPGTQRLVLIERNGRGFIESELDTVRFVPMTAGKA